MNICNGQCFGFGGQGQLGSDSTANVVNNESGDDVPTIDFGDDFNVTALATADGFVHHQCALSATDAMRCWGYGYYGQLGMGDTENRLSPVTPQIKFDFNAAAFEDIDDAGEGATAGEGMGYVDVGRIQE